MAWITISVDWLNTFAQAILAKPLFMQTPRGFLNKYTVQEMGDWSWQDHYIDWSLHIRIGIPIAKKHCQNLVYKNVHLIYISVLSTRSVDSVVYWQCENCCSCQKECWGGLCWRITTGRIWLRNWSDFTEYLGIGIEEQMDGTHHILQKGLITKIIESTNMTDCKPNWIPTMQVALGSDPEGVPYNQKDWIWQVPVLGGPKRDKFFFQSCKSSLQYRSNSHAGLKNWFNWQNFDRWVCVFIGDKTVIINVNPMRLVQRRYSIECTRNIGFSSVVTVSSPIKIQTQRSKFCQLNRFFSPTRPLDLY